MKSPTISAYAAMAKGQPLQPFEYPLPKLKPQEVRVDITHCGLCYTDIQGIEDYYHITKYPFVPGHEVVGVITEVGSQVSNRKVGERVGIGWQGRACRHCEWCLKGEVNLCQEIVADATWKPYGGFSTSIAVDADFAYPIPDGMPSESAAVMMCAGITVFVPLRDYMTSKSLRLGIIGVGGLGHLAIQFARALGYEVTAISSTPAKKEEALSLGADHFIIADDEDALGRHAYYFDLLLSTTHVCTDWPAMMEMLKKKGKLILAGFADMDFRPIDLIAHQLSIHTAFLGTPADMRSMLDFAQAHAIRPLLEQMPMRKINEAIQKLKANQVRYRMVLYNE